MLARIDQINAQIAGLTQVIEHLLAPYEEQLQQAESMPGWGRRYTGTCSFYRCWTPGPVPLSRLIAIASARWRIEEDHQLAKQSTGLDAGQVIRWKSWHRWTALCLLAYIYRAVAVALQREQEASSGLDAGLIPVTVPELLRLLRDTIIPPPRRDRPHRLHWSTGRRRHQHRARQAHQNWNAYAETAP